MSLAMPAWSESRCSATKRGAIERWARLLCHSVLPRSFSGSIPVPQYPLDHLQVSNNSKLWLPCRIPGKARHEAIRVLCSVPRVKLFPVAVETAEDIQGAEVEVKVTHEGIVQDDTRQALKEMDNMDKKPDEKGDGCAEARKPMNERPQNPEIHIQIGGPSPDDPQPPPPQPPVAGKRRIPRMCCEMEKPAVPTVYASRFGIISRGCRDFVKENALRVIRQPAKIPAANIVDQAKGTLVNWCNSGWARRYVFRKDYGMVPGYIVQRKAELEDKCKKERYASEQAQRDAREKCRHLDENERQGLICGLKTNWQQTYEEFQSLPLLIDTAAKVKHKQELEEKMKMIEKDIQLLERHNHVFVGDANRTFYLA